MFIPGYRTSVVSFLEFLMLTGKLPAEVDYKNPVPSLLADSAFWKETEYLTISFGWCQESTSTHFSYHLPPTGYSSWNPRRIRYFSGSLLRNTEDLQKRSHLLLKLTLGHRCTSAMNRGMGLMCSARPLQGKETLVYSIISRPQYMHIR